MTFLSRRGFFKTAGKGLGLLAMGGGLGAKLIPEALSGESSPTQTGVVQSAPIPFYGKIQGGITTPSQAHTYFAAFDLVAADKKAIIAMLKSWTEASARMTQGQTAAPIDPDLSKPAADSLVAQGLGHARLTLTFGFGAGLFTKDGKDRYGLAKKLPAALAPLPKFHGDQLIEAKSGGDLSVQACADDPQVAFHAIRQLQKLAEGVAQLRWAQTGFSSSPSDGSTPRNLMGFKDGTQQPLESEYDQAIWVGKEGPAWMHGGSYLVARRIRIALEHWDRTEVDFQEQVIGRHKASGAPIGKSGERDELDLERRDKDDNLIIPATAHVRLASRAANGGAQMLRRGYSYNDGVNFVAERWPPWTQAIEYDAGLFFMAYQADPRTAFVKIFGNMAKLDALNQFATHVSSALFACPPGVKPGEFIGEKLFS